MSYDLVFTPLSLSASRVPFCRTVELNGRLVGQDASDSARRIQVLRLTASVFAVPGDYPLSIQSDVPFGSLVLGGKRARDLSIVLQPQPEVWDSLEKARTARESGDIEIRVILNGLGAVLHSLDPAQRNSPDLLVDPSELNIRTYSEERRSETLRVDRDVWLGLLNNIGFERYTVFELPARTLKSVPQLEPALESLRRAEDNFRHSDWNGVLVESRAAIEAAGGAMAPTGQLPAGYAALWAAMFSEEKDHAKRAPIDETVKAFSAFLHLGRHRKPPFWPIDRRDALFALRVTLAFFEYVSTRFEGLGS